MYRSINLKYFNMLQFKTPLSYIIPWPNLSVNTLFKEDLNGILKTTPAIKLSDCFFLKNLAFNILSIE